MTFAEEESLKLQDVIEYRFKNPRLLIQALSHSSYVHERKINKLDSYERIEFLGDAVLELVSSTMLYNNFTSMSEGELSKTRASLVCEKALAPCARKIELGNYILLGHGEKLNHGYERDSILSDVMEAVIGAIYLDGGFECATAFIKRFVLNEESLHSDLIDYKTKLQEIIQAQSNSQISYEVVDAVGPDHNKVYTVNLTINGVFFGTGTGSSKKAAEQMAASCAITKMKKDRTI